MTKIIPSALLAGLLDYSTAGMAMGSAPTVWYTVPDAPLSGALYLAPKAYDKSLYGPAGAAGKAPSWTIAQWNIPSKLPVQSAPNGSGWTIRNPHGEVTVTSGDGSADFRVELSQTGDALACGVEYDLFIAPIDRLTYPGYPEGLLSPAAAESQPIGALKSLTLELNAAEAQESVTPRCAKTGKVDYGYAVAGIVLSHHHAQQVLYYQILLRDTRSTLHQHACNVGTVPWWWSGPVNYGINDTIAAYQSSCLTPGSGTHHYRLNVLERLKLHIQSGPAPLNKDLSRWKISGLYVGIGIEGSTRLRASFGGIRLYGELP